MAEKKVVSFLKTSFDVKEEPGVCTQTQIVSFYGIEDCVDMYLYLPSILAHCGKKVLVLDNTCSGVLGECVPNLNKDGGLVEYKNVGYVMGSGYDKELFFLYDIVINVSGYYYDMQMERESRYVYVVSDFQKIHLSKVQQILEKIKQDIYMIYRDVQGGCVDAAYVHTLLCGGMKNVVGRSVVALSYEDCAWSLRMQYYNTYLFDRLTLEYRALFLTIVQNLCQEYRWRVPSMFRQTVRQIDVKMRGGGAFELR